MSRLWDKGKPLDEAVLEYTAGEDYALDARLVPYDIKASLAHAQGLHAAKLLSAADLAILTTALQESAVAYESGAWQVTLQQEDGQTALEAQLTTRAGAVGGRIHLGRSRNDQVLTALRLYLKDVNQALTAGTEGVALALDRLAARYPAVALPGYTHMQQAMPSSISLWAGGFASEFRDDAAQLGHAMARADKNPLGSAAGYGTPGLPLNRNDTKERLGFAVNHEPVTAVQLSRGKAEAHLLFEICLLMIDAGRLAADLLLFYTQEFAFVTLPDHFTTGSSIMPQKRNPDVFELIRGRSSTAHACLSEVLGITAKLPSGYQRDLQLIKVPLFRGIDLAMQTLQILPMALDGLQFRPDHLHLDPAIHAAERANRLVVEEGIPFRDAYRRVAAELSEK
jgi:argininosuccinate lyase